MARERILVVEDEEDILELVCYHLKREGYTVTGVTSGEEALKQFKKDSLSLVVLDLMLPGIDGFGVVRYMKNDPDLRAIPIIMLTAKSEERDMVAGFEVGASDYIAKPVSPRILVARVKAVLRNRFGPPEGDVIECEDLLIDVRKHRVRVDGEYVNLTFTEFELLYFLASRPGWVFTRSQIVDAIRGFNYAVTDRSVDVQIVGLRRKLRQCGSYIETVRGIGYRFRESLSRARLPLS